MSDQAKRAVTRVGDYIISNPLIGIEVTPKDAEALRAIIDDEYSGVLANAREDHDQMIRLEERLKMETAAHEATKARLTEVCLDLEKLEIETGRQ
ncbi:MAG: hypothetical protein WC455_12365 [Dehalococcoidia bacterium]|jgi:hypothetical protein